MTEHGKQMEVILLFPAVSEMSEPFPRSHSTVNHLTFFFPSLQVSGVDLDFPELEHIFPHLHHQLFKPLEPYLDFDLSSSSGISQDNRHFHEVN